MDTEDVTIEWNGFGDSLATDLWQFYMSREFSDVTICTEDGCEIKSHRIILAMCSTYFRDLFSKHNGSNMIVCLSNMRYNIVKKILALIYRGIVDISSSDMQSFIKAAKYLKLQGFEKISPELKTNDIIGSGVRERYSIKLRRIEIASINGDNQFRNVVSNNDESTSNHVNGDNWHTNQENFFPVISDDSDENDSASQQ